jgi:hypothetical protein
MKRLTLIALLACALPALADRLPLPANTPARYVRGPLNFRLAVTSSSARMRADR